MIRLAHTLSALLLLQTCSTWAAALRLPATPIPVPPAGEILGSLRPSHPRLLAADEDFARVKQQAATNEPSRRMLAKIRNAGTRMLEQPPSTYEIPDGLRLLSTSRRVLQRSYTLALLARIDHDSRWRERLWSELEAAAAFPDWNPRHFLDTAEMTHAFAIAYDWLYADWSPERRELLRSAMVKKGLLPALAVYRGTSPYSAWPRARHNWNQVCNGGIGMGALALAESEPELAGEFLHGALSSIQLAMEEYGPDGAWKEGPGYWSYATSYNTVFLAALETALGQDFQISGIPGFSQASLFPIYVTGPSGFCFNYADGGDRAPRIPHLFWLARKFHQPVASWFEVVNSPSHPLDLLWYDPQTSAPDWDHLPRDKYFRGAEVVSLRSEWNRRDALFVALKAGDNRANHSHLDLGTFVMEALARRWFVDLGADDYNLPAYFGKQRWTYYRLRAEAHNTLVINPGEGPDQDPKAAGSILRFESRPERSFAIADLTAAYAKHARQVRRGVAMIDRRQVVLRDEIEAAEPVDLWWFLHTPATVELAEDGRSAMLRSGNASLWARLLEPADGRFEVRPTAPLPSSPNPAGQAKNDKIQTLALHLPSVKSAAPTVLLLPLREKETPPGSLPSVEALDRW